MKKCCLILLAVLCFALSDGNYSALADSASSLQVDIKWYAQNVTDTSFDAESFSQQLLNNNLSLTRVHSLPGVSEYDMDRISWLSISPNGRYLLGQRVVGQIDESLVLYDIMYCLLDTIEIPSYDRNSFTSQMQEHRFLSSRDYRVVWSEDESYFSFVPLKEPGQTGIVIGSAKDCKLEVVMTEYTTYQLCFGKNDKAYFGTRDQSRNPVLMEYDLISHSCHQIYNNFDSINSAEYAGDIKYTDSTLVSLPSGELFQIGWNSKHSCMTWRLLTQSETGWTSETLVYTAGMFGKSRLYCSIGRIQGSQMNLCLTFSDGSSLTCVLPIDLSFSRWIHASTKFKAVSSFLSPSSRHIIYLPTRNSSNSNSMYLHAYDFSTEKLYKLGNAKITVDDYKTMNNQDNAEYMQWGGNYILFTRPNGTVLYQFNDMQSQTIAEPIADISGSSWINSAQGVRLTFLPDGTSNMELIDYRVTTNMPFHWLNGRLTLLMDKIVDVRGVNDYMEIPLSKPIELTALIRSNRLYLSVDGEQEVFTLEGPTGVAEGMAGTRWRARNGAIEEEHYVQFVTNSMLQIIVPELGVNYESPVTYDLATGVFSTSFDGIQLHGSIFNGMLRLTTEYGWVFGTYEYVAELADVSQSYEWMVLDDGTLAITNYSGREQEISIPAELYGRKVTRIEVEAFYYSGDLTNVVIPNGVTSIGSFAFAQCSMLSTIVIPASVSSIGEWAFPDSTYIIVSPGSYAEEYCVEYGLKHTSLNQAFFVDDYICGVFADDTIVIGKYNGSDSEVVIPTEINGIPVTSIGAKAFLECRNIKSMIIPDSITSIGDYAFAQCDGLANVKLPENAHTIGCSVFYGCDSLTSVTIPNGWRSVPDSIFANCINLKSINLPESIESISKSAFDHCKALTDITIPSGVTSIGSAAFEDCKSLTSITIPKGVTSIEHYTFSRCSGLVSVTIPEGVTIVDTAAFERCDNLVNITIPDGVVTIGMGAFMDCSNLTSVFIPDSVVNIESSFAFFGCDKLVCIVNPGSYAEQYCKENGIVYTYVDELADVSQSYEWEVLDDGTLTITKYTGSEQEVSIPAEMNGMQVTSIGSGAFLRCSSLVSISIPKGVTTIGSSAFSGCESLTNITLPDGVISIGAKAFGFCHALTSIKLPGGVTSIEDAAFMNCSNLTSITIPDRVTHIGKRAFSMCYNLVCVVSPSSYAEQYCKENNLAYTYAD